jgi:hypothetical protein
LAFIRWIFQVPPVPQPICVAGPSQYRHPSRITGSSASPRCLHCKVPMTERHRELPEPYGVWAVFACRANSCPVCQGKCRNEASVFVPPHWQSGRPGEITRL